MNQYLVAALQNRRFALVFVAIAAVAGLLFPSATFAAAKADVGSAEFVTVGHWKGHQHHGHQHHGHKHCPHVYIVQKGDTLSALAAHYKTTVHALARTNGIKNPNRIYVGQRLCVPHGTPYVGPKPPVSWCKASHTVKHHDTLVSIARRYHTTVQKIIADNKLKGPHYIHSGQSLCIR